MLNKVEIYDDGGIIEGLSEAIRKSEISPLKRSKSDNLPDEYDVILGFTAEPELEEADWFLFNRSISSTGNAIDYTRVAPTGGDVSLARKFEGQLSGGYSVNNGTEALYIGSSPVSTSSFNPGVCSTLAVAAWGDWLKDAELDSIIEGMYAEWTEVV